MRIVIGIAAAGALLGGGVPVSAAAPASAFNPSFALPDGSGTWQPTVMIDGTGAINVAGSTTAGMGCPLVSLSHDGSKARYLGRPGTGVSCSASEGPLQLSGTPLASTGNLAMTSALTNGSAMARSQDGGASFTWTQTSGPIAMASLASDPTVNAGGLSTAFLVVRDAPSGVPRIAVSTDGGQTYALGDALINAVDVDPGLWQGAGPGPAVGNLVAHRTDTGLMLFSVFATADSAANRQAQASAGTDNLNRVFTAVGTVVLATRTAPPVVTWHDVEAWHAPVGSALNKALPSVTADSAGHVYIGVADGRHLYVKSDFDGTKWVPTVAPASVDSTATGLPAGMNAAVLPAVAAAANGKLDAVWYGATGGSATSSDPAGDGKNRWAVYMAQSLDGATTWTGDTVSDHLVHQGALTPSVSTPGDSLAIAVDQVSGAAAVAYVDDLTMPGTPSLFATRQCTGLSALTGLALVNDCVAPQPATPVLPGSTCPGPQITDVSGDAIDNSTAGAGHNLYNLDLVGASLTSVDPSTEQATIVLNRAQIQLPTDLAQAWWRLYWTYKSTGYYAEATIINGQNPAYQVGTVNPDGSPGPGQAVAGLINFGNAGNFTLTIPLSLIGNPPTGVTLGNLRAESFVQYAAAGASALPVTLVDIAPDSGVGADFMVGGQCAPAAALPEVPVAVLLPVIGGVIAVLVVFVRRKRSRLATSQRSDTDASANPSGGLP